MHRIRVSLGPYGYWLKSRDEDDPETVPASGLDSQDLHLLLDTLMGRRVAGRPVVSRSGERERATARSWGAD
jgi:hypothetical protein